MDQACRGTEPAEANWVAGRKRIVLDVLDVDLERLGLEDFDSCNWAARINASNHVDVATYARIYNQWRWLSVCVHWHIWAEGSEQPIAGCE
jgi:hypothetical protein